MVKDNHVIGKILSKISLYAILVAVLSTVLFHLTTIQWSHLGVLVVTVVLFHFGKVNVQYIVTFSLAYFSSLLALQRYDVDKISEITFYQVMPVIVLVVVLLFASKWKLFSSVYAKIASIILACQAYVGKQFKFKNNHLTKYIYVVIAVLFGYFTLYVLAGYLGVYGGLIVLFIGFYLVSYMLDRKRQLLFTYLAITVYTLLYNLTLTHGWTMLMDHPLHYLYLYTPSIVIPYLCTMLFHWDKTKAAESTVS